MMIDAVVNNMVSNFFGQVWVLGLVLILFVIIAMVGVGFNFSSAMIISLPIFLMIVNSGFVSGYSWIGDAVLIIVGLAYGFIMVRLLSK